MINSEIRKHFFILFILISIFICTPVFGEDIPEIDLNTVFFMDAGIMKNAPVKGYISDNKLFYRRWSFDLTTGDKRLYDTYQEFEVIYGQQNDELIVGRYVKKPERKDSQDEYVEVYFYNPVNETYKKIDCLTYDKEETNGWYDAIFPYHDDKYIVVLNFDAGVFEHYMYDIKTGDREKLIGINLYKIEYLSPDRLTAIIHWNSEYLIYDIEKQKTIYKNDNFVFNIKYLKNNVFLTENNSLGGFYLESYDKYIKINFYMPEDIKYFNQRSMKYFFWDTDYFICYSQKEKNSDFTAAIYKYVGMDEALDSLGLLFQSTTAVLNDDRVRMREWPLLDAKHLAFLEQGEEVEVLDRSGIKVKIDDMNDYWYKIKRSDGTEGWAYGYFLDLAEE